MHDIIDSKSLAILHANLTWESDFARHVETFYIPLNVWRELDLLPSSLAQALAGQRAGFVCQTSFSPRSLVLEYFLQSGAYDHLQTFSARGWPRPVSDRYFPQVPLSDPVYAVWGQTKERWKYLPGGYNGRN